MHVPPFPKTPEGTTDWEIVFEDEVEGLVPSIERTESPTALRETANLIATNLFSRADDEPQLKKLHAWISNIVPEHSDDAASLPKKKSDIVRLLRHVEAERIRKASTYVAQRQAENEPEKASERRVATPDGLPEAVSGRSRRQYMIAAVGMVGALFLAWVLTR